MGSRLTDAELIQLVQEKLPEELSLAEIRQLHERLQESSELKAVLIGQLHLETYLSTALAEINVSVDEIVRKAGLIQQTKPGTRWPLWTGLAGVLLVVGLGLYFINRPDPEQIAKNEEQPVTSEDIEPAVPDENEPADNDPPVKNPPVQPVKPVDQKSPQESEPQENVVEPEPPQIARGKPTDPWYEALEAEPLPLMETAFRIPRWQRGEPLLKAEAQTWLKPAPGKAFRIDEKEANNDRWVELNGVGKLQAPWVPGAVLRMSLFDSENFRVHFWSGEEGVTLWQYRNRRPQMWAAYRSQRKNNQPVPERLVSLLTTDDGRHSRIRSGVVEFRYQDGSLVMSQGPTRLLSVPLATAPTEIILDGRCMLSELTMYRGEPLPDLEPNPHPLVRASTVPTDTAWMTSLPGRDLREGIRELGQTREKQNEWQESLGEGILVSAKDETVRLAVEKSDKPILIGTRLDRPGFYEIIFRMEEASPGTGIFFGDDKGQDLQGIAFVRDQKTRQIVLDASRNYRSLHETDRDPQHGPVAYSPPGQWIRVVWGFNSFKVWTSGDGLHWGAALPPTRGVTGPFRTVGLFVQKTEEPRKISLAHLEIRKLSGITSLASETALKLAPLMGNLSEMDFGTWNQKVLAARPDDPAISMEEWRRACVIRSLAESPWCGLSSTLLRGLIEDGLQSPAPLEERFRLLDEVSLLYDLWSGGDAAAMVSMYERLGSIAAEEGHPDPFGLVVSQLHAAPIWTEANLQVISPEFTREMLLREAYARDWESLRSIARRTEFLMLSAHPRQSGWWDRDQRAMLDWGEMLANRKAPDQGEDNAEWIRLASRRRQWQHPLITQVSKEGYNVMAEFEAALAGDAFADACRIITSAGRAGMAGLLPDSKDPDLLVSLPRAIAIAMREHPELQQTMCEQFGEVGKVRVREAMNRADVESVEAATVRFFGTEAAGEAYRWLGDRALASGKFAQAAQAYQEALPLADVAQRRDLQHRLRLAAGMLGHTVEAETSDTVQIASASWTGPEFDRLIEQLKTSHARAESSTLADWDSSLKTQSPPEPMRLNAVVRNQFNGTLGKNAGKHDDRSTDWAARQLAVAVDGDFLFVSNRFQVVCYQMTDGKTIWAKGLGDEQGDVNGWYLIPMQPVVVGDRIFVRRLTKRGPELACLDKAKGDVLWNVRPDHHVASDPVFVQNRLLALVATMPQSGMLQLDLTAFDPESGAVLSQRPLLSLRDEWGGCPPCQILATSGIILATIGGTTVCCDALGLPQWLQQHPWVSSEVDRDSRGQHHQPPLVADGRVYVSQMGVKEVACFELATGRRLWSHAVPNIVRLVGLSGENLVIQTEIGLAGFDHLTGEETWRHINPELLHGIQCGSDQLVYSCVMEPSEEGRVCLIWLDPQTGKEVSHTILNALQGEKLRFGPLVGDGDKLWGFFGRGFKEAHRDLVELVPDTSVPPAGPLHPHPLAAWIDDVLPRSFGNTAVVLPGWLLTTTQKLSKEHKGVPWLSEFRGERSVIKTRVEGKLSLYFVREISVPAEGLASLKLKVGHDAGKSWMLRVSLGDETLLEEIVDDAAAPNGWLEREIDLKPWAGKTVWLTVSHAATESKDRGDAYWKSLEIRGK